MTTVRALLVLCFTVFTASPAFAASGDDTFFGWSKDGSWFAYQSVSGPNDLTELFFCITDEAVAPTWPAALNEMDRIETPFSCVRFTDPNRAPLGWKAQLVLPKPSLSGPNGFRVSHELQLDGERPGYVVERKDEKTTCYVSGLRETTKLGQVWWHPNGKLLAATVDGKFVACDRPLPAVAPEKKKKGKK